MVMVLMTVVSNISGDDYANWGDGENIVDCGEAKDAGGDSIGDGGLDTNGGINPDFRDDKTKVGCSDNTAGDDGNSNDDGGPTFSWHIKIVMSFIPTNFVVTSNRCCW